MGCGAIFYEGHITSLATQNKQGLQDQLYGDMFREVRTDFLQLMIRHDHEPQNDNADPYQPDFKPEWRIRRTHARDLQGSARAQPSDPILRHPLHATAVDEDEQRLVR